MDDNRDFRNRPFSDLEAVMVDAGFNEVKIKNFKKAFRTQNVETLGKLNGIKGVGRLDFVFSPLVPAGSEKDDQENEKFLFQTEDGFFIESLLMNVKKNFSICVSTQAGCSMGCRFCNTGLLGLKRNLSVHEILDQIRQIYLKRIFPGRLNCITFMGMGEPLHNLKNSMKALEWICSDWGWQVSRHKTTVSTSGCLSLEDFLAYKKLPNLAFSLHSACEETRKKIMPRARISLESLKNQLRQYTQKTGRPVTVQYCFLKGINDRPEDAEALAEFVKDLYCKINFLNYNQTEGQLFHPAEPGEISFFAEYFKSFAVPVLFRKSLGAGIKGGCGQLGSAELNARNKLSV